MGVDYESGLVHTLEVIAAHGHDVCMTANLLTGEKQVVYGDSGYLGAEKRPEAVAKTNPASVFITKSAVALPRANAIPPVPRHRSSAGNMKKSSVRSKVEHIFAVVKQQFRYRKTRYRDLRKRTEKLNMLFALANNS